MVDFLTPCSSKPSLLKRSTQCLAAIIEDITGKCLNASPSLRAVVCGTLFGTMFRTSLYKTHKKRNCPAYSPVVPLFIMKTHLTYAPDLRRRHLPSKCGGAFRAPPSRETACSCSSALLGAGHYQEPIGNSQLGIANREYIYEKKNICIYI